MAKTLEKIRATVGGRRADVQLPAIPGVDPSNLVLGHLDSQIRWYDANAQRTMTWHFRLRGLQLVIAALIPVTQVFSSSVGLRAGAASMAALVAIAQGFDSIHHYGEHYVKWRATCQKLCNERHLFAVAAGPYGKPAPHSPEALALLAQRTSAIEGQEQAQWQAEQLREAAAAVAPHQK